MELIDANELLKHEAHAKAYAPEMLVVGKGHVMAAKRHTDTREALALAHAILAKIPPRDVAHAHKRAAIKHEGNDPMAYIAGVLANPKDQP